MSQVLEVLLERSRSWQLNTVGFFVKVISKRHALVQGILLSVEGTVRKWVSGLKLSKGVAGCYYPVGHSFGVSCIEVATL